MADQKQLIGFQLGEGRVVFESGKGSCLACHRIGNEGGLVGPDLSTIGRIRTARDLFESILYPGESIARDFDTFEVTRNDGKPGLIGVVERQTASSLVMIDAGGNRHEVPHSAVESRNRIGVSLMPPGLEQTLSSKELNDLVAYLISLK